MISTYAELQTEVNRWSHRSDMTARVPDFIALAEARMNDALILKDMEVEETLSSAIGANYVALPTGYVSPKKLWIIIDGERKEMWPVAVTALEYDTDNTIPSKWAVDGANLRFDVPADKVYSMPFRFVKKSNLSDSVTTLPPSWTIFSAACVATLPEPEMTAVLPTRSCPFVFSMLARK